MVWTHQKTTQKSLTLTGKHIHRLKIKSCGRYTIHVHIFGISCLLKALCYIVFFLFFFFHISCILLLSFVHLLGLISLSYLYMDLFEAKPSLQIDLKWSMLRLVIGVVSTAFVLIFPVCALGINVHEWDLMTPSHCYLETHHSLGIFVSSCLYIKVWQKFKCGYFFCEANCAV